MIFVTLGTQDFQFDRLIRQLEHLPVGEELVVQCHRSAIRPPRAVWFDDLPFESFVDHMRSARIVICHAGVGSIMTAAANGKRAIVVPRLHRFGEAVDDHQLLFARKLSDTGVVTLVEDPRDLPVVLAGTSSDSVTRNGGNRLAADLREYLETIVNRDRVAAYSR